MTSPSPRRLRITAAINIRQIPGYFRGLFLLLLLFRFEPTLAQVSNAGMTDRDDSLETGKVNINGYVDTYYGSTVNGYDNGIRPYSVSANANADIAINLAYMDIRYHDNWVRARFTPSVGTYMDANYAAEPGTLKNILEANAGVKLSSKKEIWLDAGVIGSPFTNETPLSRDHLLYSRTFAAEYSPYYLCGLRLTVPLRENFSAYVYVVNGWQQIVDQNKSPALAAQLEYRPGKKLLLNWSGYFGDEYSAQRPEFGKRYFSDVYAIYVPNQHLTLTADAYMGLQLGNPSQAAPAQDKTWWQANTSCQYAFNKRYALAARLEYFEDLQQVMVIPATTASSFSVFSGSLCFNWHLNQKALFRLEGRQYYSDQKIFKDQSKGELNTDLLLISSLSVAF